MKNKKGILTLINNEWFVKSPIKASDKKMGENLYKVYQETLDLSTKQQVIVLEENKSVEFEIKKVFLSDQTIWYAKLINTDNKQSLKEITDEEIEKQSWIYEPRNKFDAAFIREAFIRGAEWYREQLKSK